MLHENYIDKSHNIRILTNRTTSKVTSEIIFTNHIKTYEVNKWHVMPRLNLKLLMRRLINGTSWLPFRFSLTFISIQNHIDQSHHTTDEKVNKRDVMIVPSVFSNVYCHPKSYSPITWQLLRRLINGTSWLPFRFSLTVISIQNHIDQSHHIWWEG